VMLFVDVAVLLLLLLLEKMVLLLLFSLFLHVWGNLAPTHTHVAVAKMPHTDSHYTQQRATYR
jgi:hypothetical protein